LKNEKRIETIDSPKRRFGRPLLSRIAEVSCRIKNFRTIARDFYFQVVLSVHRCPQCDGRIEMIGKSRCTCDCGYVFDPTLVFQKSPCCGRPLLLKTFHYACSTCHKTVPSMFLFDEKLFDKTYFREVMRQSRARAAKRKEMMRRLAEPRSGSLVFDELPSLQPIHGLVEDLDCFVGSEHPGSMDIIDYDESGFSLAYYRKHILELLGDAGLLFSDIRPLVEDFRKDRAWRFITLIFMQNDTEITLTQHGNDLWVERGPGEAYQ
jgi:hypothetical protein